ncbi:Crp/Fnr family transcriptional regulator [Treponema berlinense]|uniref:Crp/Fnr family transcriptional regulator n=1 Tax=Treponema berlinense TaxID=225004 RepID=UPI0026EA7E14|nr:Crp/Fnr family transcriptional regulator [Treponema berlinense]
MPKVMQYNKGAIIYFAGDHDERVFILQKGCVVISSTDIESNLPVTEQIKNGEFFGVKSALGHFPREETATVLMDSVCISLTVQEFENIFSSNKALILKMLRVFSNQLRHVHTQMEEILNKGKDVNRQSGLLSVAQAFYDDEKWRSCADVCLAYLKRYPGTPDEGAVKKMFVTSQARAESASRFSASDTVAEGAISGDKSLKVFELPAFDRFTKKYEPGQVIIAEFEPGESFYLIQKGTVQLVKCVNGQNKNLDILKPGEFFGEMAILDNSPRSATCLALGNVQCLEFNKANFELLITGNPQIALNILKLFCKRIYDQKRRFKILVIQDPQARVADVFCMLNEMNPPANPNEKQRRFNVTVQDVAQWAALPLQKTMEELNNFASARKIEIFESNIIVNNIAAMKRIVDTRSIARQ